MSRWRDLLLVVVLFSALAGATILTYPLLSRSEPAQPPQATTHSAAPEGCKALYLWLTDLGYEVRRIEGEFVLPSDVDVLFVLGPTRPFTLREASQLVDWIAAGHTLVLTPNPILAGDEHPWNLLYLDLGPERVLESEISPTQPLLLYPPVRRVAHGASCGLVTRGLNAIPLLGPAREPVMLTFTREQGRVYALAGAYPFTNAGIDQADNARLILNLAGAPGRAGIAFDEYHHGYVRPPVEFTAVLFTQPWGWAALYGMGATVLYLALRGRRLGRAVPAESSQRRTVAEYVSSMAGLFRRAGQRDAIRRHYRREFRRQLAQPGGFDPELPAEEFARQLARYQPVDPADLTDLLRRLDRPTSEAGLLRLVQELEEFVKRK